jgi:hypothetical protein
VENRDRRRHARYAEDAQVLCVSDAGAGGFHTARLAELSVEGMRIETSRPFAAGEQLYAGILLEESREPLVVLGVVMHCDARPEGATVGLQFLSVTEDQRGALVRLAEYLKRRHGEAATVTVRAAPAIRRIGEERWW